MERERKNKQLKVRVEGAGIYNLSCFGEEDAKGEIMTDTLFCDYNYTNFDIAKLVKRGDNFSSNEIKIAEFFRPIKKEFEKKYRDTLLVFEYSSTFQYSLDGKKTQIRISLAKYYDKMKLERNTLNIHKDEIVKLIDEIREEISERIDLVPSSKDMSL